MRLIMSILVVFLLVGGVAAALANEGPGAALVSGSGVNLIANPSFEGQYSAYVPPNGHPDCPSGVCNTAQMAPGWTPFWRSHDPGDPGWIIRMPEYKPADPMFTNPPRVRSGGAAQQYFTFFSTHEAGIYQQVNVIPGAEYSFSIWGHSWSAEDDDDAYSGPSDGQLFQRVGLDPTGGADWQSSTVLWGTPRLQYDAYGLFELRATAQGPTMTAFAYSQPDYAVKHNDVYWDDASLVLSSAPVNPAAGFTLFADVDVPEIFHYPVRIYWNGDPNVDWGASVNGGGTLSLGLSAPSGDVGQDLIVTVNSAGLSPGTYSANVTLTANPPVPESPVTLAVTLIVAPEIYYAAMPAVAGK